MLLGDPAPVHASEIEVLFIEQNGQTKVDFQHRYIERLGAGAEDLAKTIAKPDGWPGILDRFGEAAARL